ncbi:MAG: serine hydrolase family protein [Gammaproteobacteria bacterium]|nr:serine hydrolase family protein [Gammaproteobacteria bacterium]
MDKSRLKKIICLHGYAMNHEWLQSWLDLIQQRLGHNYQLLYPKGPIECPVEEVRAMTARFNMMLPDERIGKGKNWCWYRADEQKPPHYHQIETALDYLADYFSQHGPIDGVIGWSQGAVMTAILAALKQNRAAHRFDFNWAMLCGGFLPGDVRYRAMFEPPLNLPTLHVSGEKESPFMRKQATKMQAAFLKAERLDTPCGHIMPVKYPDDMDRITDWIIKPR